MQVPPDYSRLLIYQNKKPVREKSGLQVSPKPSGVGHKAGKAKRGAASKN